MSPVEEEIRWQVVKAMLDEFPRLRERVKEYLKNQNTKSAGSSKV